MTFGEITRQWLIALAALADQNDAALIRVETHSGLVYELADGELEVYAAGEHMGSLSFEDLAEERFDLVDVLKGSR